MHIAIDRLGRVVIPKQVRDRFHLIPGTELDLNIEADGFRISPVGRGESLVSKQGILVHHGDETVNLDISGYIDRERENRNLMIVAEGPPE